MLRFVAVCVVVLSALASPMAHATKVKGKVVVTNALRQSLSENTEKERNALTSGYWKEPNGVVQVASVHVDPSSDLGVVLIKEGAPDRGADDVKSINVLTGALERNVIVVQPGTRIKFIAAEPYDHELYSPDHGRFPPERQAKGAFRPIDFKEEGAYRVKCKLFPHFQGWVLVTKSTQVLDVSPNGEFSLDEAEPGKYKIKVFLRGEWIHEQSFEVEDEKEVQVEVKLEPKPDAEKAKEPKADQKEEKDPSGKEGDAAK